MTDAATVPAKLVTENKNKAVVAARYLASNATGAMSLFVVLGMLSPDQQTQILANAHIMVDSTRQFVGAFANIWYIVFPILAVWLAKAGINSAGIGSMMDRIFAMAKSGNLAAKVAIVNAAASPAIGTQAIVNPELAPLGATAGNVVSTPAAVPAALPQNPAPAT